MVFLVFTGQFSKLYYGHSGSSEASLFPPRDPSELNLFVYHSHDLKRGRVRFTIRGVLEGGSDLEINFAELRKKGTLGDAILELPI